MKLSRLAALAVGSLAAVSVGLTTVGGAVAPSGTVTFDDLGTSVIGTHMADGYAGMRWATSDWYFMSDAAGTNTYLALGGRGTAILSSDGSDFLFEGLDAFSRRGLDATGSFYFVLYHDGVTVYNGLLDKDGRQRFTGAMTSFVPTYTGPVDGVAIAFAQGGDDWDHLAIDNLRLEAVAAPVTTTAAPTTTVAPPPPAPGPAPAPAPAQSFKLTVKTNGKGTVTASRAGNTFVAGQVITLTATPAAGSTWRGWSGDVTSTDLSITFTVTKDMVITANFR
ncbi:MAG: hypothetical protein RL238_1172 [Actinomycetota bacterium]|jgi:hypothetical protein